MNGRFVSKLSCLFVGGLFGVRFVVTLLRLTRLIVHSTIGMDGNDEMCDAHGLQFSNSSSTTYVGERHSVQIKKTYTHQETTMGQHARRTRTHSASIRGHRISRKLLSPYTHNAYYAYEVKVLSLWYVQNFLSFFSSSFCRSFSISFGFALKLSLYRAGPCRLSHRPQLVFYCSFVCDGECVGC